MEENDKENIDKTIDDEYPIKKCLNCGFESYNELWYCKVCSYPYSNDDMDD